MKVHSLGATLELFRTRIDFWVSDFLYNFPCRIVPRLRRCGLLRLPLQTEGIGHLIGPSCGRSRPTSFRVQRDDLPSFLLRLKDSKRVPVSSSGGVWTLTLSLERRKVFLLRTARASTG